MKPNYGENLATDEELVQLVRIRKKGGIGIGRIELAYSLLDEAGQRRIKAEYDIRAAEFDRLDQFKELWMDLSPVEYNRRAAQYEKADIKKKVADGGVVSRGSGGGESPRGTFCREEESPRGSGSPRGGHYVWVADDDDSNGCGFSGSVTRGSPRGSGSPRGR